MTQYYYSNTASVAQLSAPVNSSAPSVTLSGATGFPTSYPFWAIMGRGTGQAEVVIVTNVVGSTYSITRGQDGTLASDQSGGNTFEHIIPASLANRAEVHMEATTGVHGVSGSVVGTSGAQTITDKEYRGHFTHAYADGLPAGVASGFEVTATAATARDGFLHSNTAGDVDRRGFLLTQSGTARFEVFNDGSTRVTPNSLSARPGVEARTTSAKSALRVGNTSAGSAQTFDVTGNGNTAIAGTLAVTGVTTLTGDVDLALQAGGAVGNRAVIRTQPGQVPLSIKDSGGFNVFTIGASGNVDASGYVATAGALSAGTTLAVTGTSTLTGNTTLPLPAAGTTPRLTINSRTGGTQIRANNQAGTATFQVEGDGQTAINARALIYNLVSPVIASVSAPAVVPLAGTGHVVWDETTKSWQRYSGSVWLPIQPIAFLRQTSAQSIPNAAFTALTFNAEDLDTHACHDNVTNNSRFTCPTGGDGWYELVGGIGFAANGTGVRGGMWAKNGTDLNASQTLIGTSGGALDTNIAVRTALVQLTAGDYVELRAYQNSGGALNTLAGGTAGSFMFVKRVHG